MEPFCFESYKYTARLTSEPFPAPYRESILNSTLAYGTKVINVVSVDLGKLAVRVD